METNGHPVPHSDLNDYTTLSLHGNQMGGNHRFSARDVLETAIHESFGLFVQMEKNFLSQNSSNSGNEASRYHQAVGSANGGNVLPKIVTELRNDTKLGPLAGDIEKLMKLFETFPSEYTSYNSEYKKRSEEILELIQKILSRGRSVLQIKQPSF